MLRLNQLKRIICKITRTTSNNKINKTYTNNKKGESDQRE